MKAVSIRQPYAHLIITGQKDIENRSWPTSHRGPLLIHAAQKVDFKSIAAVSEHLGIKLSLDEMKFGGIVGIVDLVDVVRTSSSRSFVGPLGWVLENPRPLPFFETKGQLSLFDVQLPYVIGAVSASHDLASV